MCSKFYLFCKMNISVKEENNNANSDFIPYYSYSILLIPDEK